jgi:hypothetical protein
VSEVVGCDHHLFHDGNSESGLFVIHLIRRRVHAIFRGNAFPIPGREPNLRPVPPAQLTRMHLDTKMRGSIIESSNSDKPDEHHPRLVDDDTDPTAVWCRTVQSCETRGVCMGHPGQGNETDISATRSGTIHMGSPTSHANEIASNQRPPGETKIGFVGNASRHPRPRVDDW